MRIKTDHTIQQIIEQPLSLNIFTSGNTSGSVNGKFVFSQVLIECLLRLKLTDLDRDELIKHCKNIYRDNRFEMSNLREFQKEYSSKNAVWWYTRDTFFFKTLNAVLRAENIHMIYLFRGYIDDIQRQLKTYQTKDSLIVYRGQLISKSELETLQNSCGQFISVNSFFSTSTRDKKARSFLDASDISENLERVLFEITADSNVAATKPFADISSLSEYSGESEVLFMIGSIFRLNSIKRNNDSQLWIIRITLCSENESDLKNVLVHMKQQLGSGETNLRTLGKVLWKMGRLDLAEFYLVRLLNDLPPKHHLLGDLYGDLSEIAGLLKNYDKSVEYQQKALEHGSRRGVADKIQNDKDLTSKPMRSVVLEPYSPSSSKTVKASTNKTSDNIFKGASESQNIVPEKTWPLFFELNLRVVSPREMNSIKIGKGSTHAEILIQAPSNVQLLGHLKDSNNEKIFGGDRVFFDRHRQLWRCLFAPNQNGTFKANILAKRSSDPGSYTSACRYTLEASQISSTPLSYPKTWQLFYDLGLEIEAAYDRAIIPWSENASYAEIRMRAPDNVHLSCNIKYNDNKIENGTLTQYDSDRHNWQLLFAPQHTGLHELCVYGKRENDAASSSHSVAEFHLNVTRLKQSIKFPETYSKFNENRCYILEPIHDTLKRGSLTLIHCRIPGATDVNVQIDSNWDEKGGYHDPFYKKPVKVGSKTVTVYAKYGHKSRYDGLFKYTVR